MTQKTSERSPADTVKNLPDKSKNAEITEPMARVKIEGQEFELEANLAKDDKILKTVLQPHFASVENANITRNIKDGRLLITIVKKAQYKGR